MIISLIMIMYLPVHCIDLKTTRGGSRKEFSRLKMGNSFFGEISESVV